MANGELSPSSMRVLPGFDPYPARENFLPASTTSLSDLVLPGVYIDAVNMGKAFRRDMGQTLTYAEAYRSHGMQEQRAREHANGGPLAAYPGTSNHGWGKSIDYRNNIGTITSPEYGWMAENASRFGFLRDVPSEGWHWTHPSDTAVTTLTGASDGTPTPIEDDDMYTDDDRKRDVKAAADAAAAKANSNQANDRALKALNAVRELADPKNGVGKLVWGFTLSPTDDGKTFSASAIVRKVYNNVTKTLPIVRNLK